MQSNTPKYGFLRVAAAIPEVRVADCIFNTEKILESIGEAIDRQVQIVCFPELCISAYTCGDLFLQDLLINESEKALCEIIKQTASSDIIGIIGSPVRAEGLLFNAAIVFQSGKILGVIPKTCLPNYNEFYEKRWFSSAEDVHREYIQLCEQEVPFGTNILFGNKHCLIGVEICEDLWAPIPPSSRHTLNGAHIIFNLSASNELAGKNEYRKDLIRQQSGRCHAGYIYVSSGWGESTTDLVFTGNATIAENGVILSEAERFSLSKQLVINEIDIDRLKADRQRKKFGKSGDSYRIAPLEFSFPENMKLSRKFPTCPFIPEEQVRGERCEEIFSIQTIGLAKRLKHTNARTTVIGISGGLDSALALLVCVKTHDMLNIPRKNIIGLTMPGFGTTGRTYNNAIRLMQSLGITIREVDIQAACEQHFKDIGHDPSIHDVTYENTQARERTQILMDMANQAGGLVVGTGDMSELALGWATYNGDHMSMYGVNAGVPKTLVRYLVRWFADTQIDSATGDLLRDIIDTPVSPELIPADNDGQIKQKTENLVGPYELHDFFLYYMIRFGFEPEKIFFLAKHAFQDIYDTETISKWMRIFYQRFFAQQFKRSCLPDGPKVGSINLSPRGDWRMPSDASAQLWLKKV